MILLLLCVSLLLNKQPSKCLPRVTIPDFVLRVVHPTSLLKCLKKKKKRKKHKNVNHLRERSYLFNEFQLGFRSHHSTETAAISVQSKINNLLLSWPDMVSLCLYLFD